LRPGNVVSFTTLGRLFRTSASSWVTTASSMPRRARERSAWNMCRSRIGGPVSAAGGSDCG
jgi:hypothetical protein